MPSIASGPSILTLIRRNVKETLGRIASVAGYSSDVPAVDSPEQEGRRSQHFRCEVSTSSVQWSTEGFSHGRDEITWNFDVVADVLKPEDEAGDTDEYVEAIADDIRRALCIDDTRGGYAIWTKPTGWVPRTDMAGCVVSFEVYYQTNYGEPNEQ